VRREDVRRGLPFGRAFVTHPPGVKVALAVQVGMMLMKTSDQSASAIMERVEDNNRLSHFKLCHPATPLRRSRSVKIAMEVKRRREVSRKFQDGPGTRGKG